MQRHEGRFLIILFLLLSQQLWAGDTIKYRLSYEAAIFNETFNIPLFKNYTDEIKIHAGGRIGIEYLYKERKYRSNFQNLNFLIYYHKTLHTALILNTEYGERYKITSGLYADWMMGLGYFQAIYDINQYRYNENGEFEKSTRLGYPRVVVSANLGMGYDFGVKFRSPVSCFLRYSFLSDIPYRKGVSNFGAHTCIQFGIRLKNKKLL
jgi:hypothetical protein